MPEFQVIRRRDVPNAVAVRDKVLQPVVRLHRNGQLFFSVLAIEAMGAENCRVLAEFDATTNILRFTRAEKLPHGLSEEECFRLRIGQPKRKGRPFGTMNASALLKYIGFRRNGPQAFDIVAIDPDRHSISLALPAAQFVVECESSSH